MQPEVDRRWWERKGSRWLLNASSSLIFHGKESLSSRTSPFILTGELQFLRSFAFSFLWSPCAAWSPGTKNSPNHSFLLQQRDLMGAFSPVQAQGSGTSGPLESLFSYRAPSAPASRMLFDYQKGNKKIIASRANRWGFPQDHISFGFIQSSEQYWAPLLKPKVTLFETIVYGCLRSAKKSLCNFNLFNLCF